MNRPDPCDPWGTTGNLLEAEYSPASVKNTLGPVFAERDCAPEGSHTYSSDTLRGSLIVGQDPVDPNCYNTVCVDNTGALTISASVNMTGLQNVTIDNFPAQQEVVEAGLPNAASTVTNVGVTSTQVLGVNPNRKSTLISNNSMADVYVNFGGPATMDHHRIAPQGSLSLGPYTGIITAISASPQDLCVTEFGI